MSNTLYWHDYETFGADPRRDRPAQFAGVRTDEDLNVIGESLMLYCRPAPDFLPHPEASLITGISPQTCLEAGVPEVEFIGRIHDQLAQPGTCGVGYNTIRFDDEFTRYTLYRNFYDPYAREWQNGCSRWDILDMLRLTRALRPEGIEWPTHPDGKASFKLEHLTQANGLQHAAAHDALSDVLATIAVARLVKQRQPKLYDYVYRLRDKREVMAQLDLLRRTPMLHVSGMYPPDQGCISLVVPLAQHPVNRNEITVFDLRYDPSPLFELNAEEIRQRVFSRAEDLPEGIERLPLKTIHANKCPIIAPKKMLTPDVAARWNIDLDACHRHHALIAEGPDLSAKLNEVFARPPRDPVTDPDQMLYTGGFFSARDKAALNRVRATHPDELSRLKLDFDDPRLPEMLFRYRARNYPDTLLPAERAHWEEYRRWRITDPAGGASITLESFEALLAAKRQAPGLSERDKKILDDLARYAAQLLEN